MIGGAMLACAVGAMLLIARWSLQRDDAADPATGLLALRSWSGSAASSARKQPAKRRRRRAPEEGEDPDGPRLKANGKRDRRPDPATRRRRR